MINGLIGNVEDLDQTDPLQFRNIGGELENAHIRQERTTGKVDISQTLTRSGNLGNGSVGRPVRSVTARHK